MEQKQFAGSNKWQKDCLTLLSQWNMICCSGAARQANVAGVVTDLPAICLLLISLFSNINFVVWLLTNINLGSQVPTSLTVASGKLGFATEL